MGTRVYVGRLPSDVEERDLERFFKGYGRINDIMLRKGYGFVDFDDYRDAEDAIYELNGEKLLGNRIVVEPTRKVRPQKRRREDSWFRTPTRTNHRLIVENLSSRINWRDLKDYMSRAGEVTFADAHRDRLYEGMVEFANKYDMKKAIKMLNNTELNGRVIRLVEDRQRSSSRSSRSRSCSRSRSRARSRSCSRSRSRARSRSCSRSRSPSRSRSRTVVKNGRSRSRSSSDSRSRSRSRYSSSSDSTRSGRSSSRSASRSPSVPPKRRCNE